MHRWVRHPATTLGIVAALAGGFYLQQSRSYEAPAESRDVVAAVDALLRKAQKERSIPGMSVVITRGGETVLARGYGTADRTTGAAATAQTVYQIGSISKQLTAAAILRLAERGRLALDDRVTDLLPELRADWREVRLRHLLHQTSGIPDFLFLLEFGAQSADLHRPVTELLALIARQPLQFAPGERWSYSNSNYTLLAAIIERITNQPYERFLEEELFRPLGLASMHHCAPSPTAPHHARGYVLRDGAVTAAPPENMSWARGDGGLCASAEDLARWARALGRGEAVAPTSYRQMTASEAVRDGTVPAYGFGLSLLDLAGRPKVAHHGAMTGFTGMLARYPDDDLVVAVLANRGGLWADAIEKAAARPLLGLPAPAARALPLAAAELADYEGTYDLGAFEVRVVRRGDDLWMETPPPAPSSRLLFQGEGRFAAKSEPDAVALAFEPAGRGGRRLVLTMAGMAWYGMPLPP